MKVTAEMIERGARAFVWEFYGGCVSWEDTDDTDTTGSTETRVQAWCLAAAVLDAAHGQPE